MSHNDNATEVVSELKDPNMPRKGAEVPGGQGQYQMTNIDRRGAKRTVPMKLLCLGLSRSGTASLRQALFDLGYHDVYHYTSVVTENQRDAELWVEALQAKYYGIGKPYGRKEFDALLGHCMAVSDAPSYVFYRELLEAYPEAKVILTVRDSPDDWHKSFVETIQPYLEFLSDKDPPKGLYDWLFRKFRPKDPFWQMNNLLSKHWMYPILRECGDIWYQGYNSDVKRIVPADKLLVYNVKEGWAPLCKFLDKPIPDQPFHRINERELIIHNIDNYLIQTVRAQTQRRMLGALGAAISVIAACSFYLRPIRLW